MPACRIAALLALATLAAFGQAPLDDATIGKLVSAGVAEQTIVAMIKQQPGNYSLSSDDVISLKKAGASDNILAAMTARNEAVSGGSVNTGETVPAVLALHDGTPIRLRLTTDLVFGITKPGDRVEFEILDDLRLDGVLVIAHGTRASATMTEAEPKTRMGRGGKLGVNLDSVPLLNGEKAAVRGTKEAQVSGPAGNVTTAPGTVIRPAAPSLLFAFGRDELFPEGTEITAYFNGEMKLDASRFLIDMTFTSNPRGALVNMYGAPIGRTPFTARLAAGTYKTIFSVDGYHDLTQSVSVGPGHTNTVHAVFESKR